MATNTDNFDLIKQDELEFYDVKIVNTNLDTIDGALKTLQDAINSGATEQEIELLRQELASHLADKANPHGVTKSQVGLSNVDNTKQIPATEKGAANGVATLDASKKITTTQIPDLGSLGVVKSAEGSYVGDTSDYGQPSYRFINVGFTPKLVFLFKRRPSDQYPEHSGYIFKEALNTGKLWLSGTAGSFCVTNNGFYIGNYTSGDSGYFWNRTNETYHWLALG